ncbi:MAG: type II toxin-antitoxin system RelE/ParE family toxin [Gaiellales bacterium]|nr:type II toxin-antitoxin system RelE/ParE family toxin [Gaiellales bacterium]
MSDAITIAFSVSAQNDLLDILDWYVSHELPQVGRRLVEDILARVEQLAAYPDSGRVVPEFEMPWLRELELPPFRIVYRRSQSAVTIVRVWRSERLMDAGLGENA